jgi:hypothetical protein
MKWLDYFDTVRDGISCVGDAFDTLRNTLWCLCVLPVSIVLVVLLYVVLFPFWLIGKLYDKSV